PARGAADTLGKIYHGPELLALRRRPLDSLRHCRPPRTWLSKRTAYLFSMNVTRRQSVVGVEYGAAAAILGAGLEPGCCAPRNSMQAQSPLPRDPPNRSGSFAAAAIGRDNRLPR